MSLYRIAQEALNNVVKHSHAAEARVVLERGAATVRLAVVDDGDGFDAHSAAASDRPGFGLNGMAERVRLLGGTLTIRSAPGHGTTVEALLPATPGRRNAKEE
jgi:two-component system, NarL family, sensor kinase